MGGVLRIETLMNSPPTDTVAVQGASRVPRTTPVAAPSLTKMFASRLTMTFVTRSLSPRESRVVLDMAERGSKVIERGEIIDMLAVSPQAADHVIRSLRRKGWLERASWGRYLLIPPEMGPDVLGESNVLALASRIAEPCYFGYGPVDVLGYTVMMSDRQKTVIDCIDRPDLAGGEGEAATILATACRRIDWYKVTS